MRTLRLASLRCGIRTEMSDEKFRSRPIARKGVNFEIWRDRTIHHRVDSPRCRPFFPSRFLPNNFIHLPILLQQAWPSICHLVRKLLGCFSIVIPAKFFTRSTRNKIMVSCRPEYTDERIFERIWFHLLREWSCYPWYSRFNWADKSA